MYPDYADVTIPVNIAPLNFEIHDKHLTNIETILTIEGADANDADNTLTATSNSPEPEVRSRRLESIPSEGGEQET